MKSQHGSFSVYHVNAFTRQLFTGNPAMVCHLPHWLSEQTLQRITQEHAFQVSPRGGELLCRFGGNRVWLSGHAVLYLTGQIFMEEKDGD